MVLPVGEGPPRCLATTVYQRRLTAENIFISILQYSHPLHDSDPDKRPGISKHQNKHQSVAQSIPNLLGDRGRCDLGCSRTYQEYLAASGDTRMVWELCTRRGGCVPRRMLQGAGGQVLEDGRVGHQTCE